MVLRDDGVGFDVEAPGPEGHYGMTMMRERATVGGGTFAMQSVPGEGTTITVRFPTSWLQEEESQDQARTAGSRVAARPVLPAAPSRPLRPLRRSPSPHNRDDQPDQPRVDEHVSDARPPGRSAAGPAITSARNVSWSSSVSRWCLSASLLLQVLEHVLLARVDQGLRAGRHPAVRRDHREVAAPGRSAPAPSRASGCSRPRTRPAACTRAQDRRPHDQVGAAGALGQRDELDRQADDDQPPPARPERLERACRRPPNR